MCSSCMESPRTSSTKTSLERTKSASEIVSGFSTASIGWPAAIRPSNGSTMVVFTLMACFRQPFLLQIRDVLMHGCQRIQPHPFADFIKRRGVTVLLHKLGDEVIEFTLS